LIIASAWSRTPVSTGSKAAARAFRTTVPTVRKWLRRYARQGLKGLQELSRAPHSCPHKIVGELAQQVVELRRQLPTFGARRLQREWELPLGHMAIQRILREHGLIRPRRRKYQKKQDLAKRKETWALFQQISADTKDLDDIPHYWPPMQAHGLPAVQYTAREVRSGLPFLAYSSHRSAPASILFAQRIQAHLARCGVTLRDLTGQTDNGSEFIGELQPDGSRSHFPAAVTYFGSQHERIPPGAHTYQSPSADGSRPSTASSKTSSSTWKASPAGSTSWPRLLSTSSTSTWLALTPINEVSPRGRSSSNSLPAFLSASACFLPPSSIIVSMQCVATIAQPPGGDTIYPVFPSRRFGFFAKRQGNPWLRGSLRHTSQFGSRGKMM
jgi:transposase